MENVDVIHASVHGISTQHMASHGRQFPNDLHRRYVVQKQPSAPIRLTAPGTVSYTHLTLPTTPYV